MESEVFTNVFTEQTNIIEEEEDPCEDQIRSALDKALDDDIDDMEDWGHDPIEDAENISPNKNTTQNTSTKSSNNKSNNSYNSHQTALQNNLKHSYQHNGGQWPLPQPPQPLHPYLKVNPYAMPGAYPGPYPPFAPYPYPPQSYGGYDSATYDSSETGTGNNTEQLSRDDYYPIGADNKSEWNSYSESGNNQCNESVECGVSLPLDSSEVEDSDVIHPPEQLNALYRANQRKLEQITSQLQETQSTYNKQIHQLQHKVGLLQTEKNILECQLSQREVKTAQLEEAADKEKLEKEEERKAVARLEEKVITMELQLQERGSEVDRLSYQLKDAVPKKESDYYEQMVNKVKALGQQQSNELKRKLDDAKRDIIQKNLEIEKLKVELENSVRNKITGIENDMKTREKGLKKALYELLLILPKINMIDVSLPLVSEVEQCDIGELTAHVSVITSRLCDSDVTPCTLAARIDDLTTECDTLRHTAAQLQSRVVNSERLEKDALSSGESKDRSIQFLQKEVAQLQDTHNQLHDTLNHTEQRADTAISRERVAMEKLADAEKRCEETLIEQTNILKRLRGVEETHRLDKMAMENRIEESRLRMKSLEEELDKNKELYVSLSKDKISLQKVYEEKVTKDKEAILSQIEHIKRQYQTETDRLLQQKEEDMLQSFACERRHIESTLEGDYVKKLQIGIEEAVKVEIENSQKQWSGASNATNVSTLCILEMTHRACQTDLSDNHFTAIWQREREAELGLARETAVALARATWYEENEKNVKNRIDAIVRHRKEEWLKEALQTNHKEVEVLRLKLSNAVSKTEEMRTRIEKEYKSSLMKTNEEYKAEISRLLKIEREKSAKQEKEVVSLQVQLEHSTARAAALQTENKTYVQTDICQQHELQRLQTALDQVPAEETTRQTKEEVSELKHQLQLKQTQELQMTRQCELVIGKMKAELLKYAEHANQQALDYVKRTILDCKEATAQKYKKYYQRLLYCLIEKHPVVKNTVKHLQLTLPKQVARTPSSHRVVNHVSEHVTHNATSNNTPNNKNNNTQSSNDSGLPSTQDSQPIRAQYTDHVTCSQPISVQYTCNSTQDSLFSSQPRPYSTSRLQGYHWNESGSRSDSDVTPNVSGNASRSRRKLVLGRFQD